MAESYGMRRRSCRTSLRKPPNADPLQMNPASSGIFIYAPKVSDWKSNYPDLHAPSQTLAWPGNWAASSYAGRTDVYVEYVQYFCIPVAAKEPRPICSNTFMLSHLYAFNTSISMICIYTMIYQHKINHESYEHLCAMSMSWVWACV